MSAPPAHDAARPGSADDAAQPTERGAPLPELAGRLGFLLKHAQLRLAGLTASALAPLGISGRQCAVLIAIDSRDPLSQQEVAERLGVDRTTMVALIDELEDKGLVERRRDPSDRRKNVVALTGTGNATLRQARRATTAAERAFLGSLPGAEAEQLRKSLLSVGFPPPAEPPD